MTDHTAIAHVPTGSAGRYLGQLCKHFAHRVPVTHDGAHGRIDFDFGRCALEAGTEALTLRVSASSEESLGQTEDVIARHLERFAFRDELKVSWKRPAL
ncbi:MAG: DUF2218 domain-containing protein [Dongiaceae bacterium]